MILFKKKQKLVKAQKKQQREEERRLREEGESDVSDYLIKIYIYWTHYLEPAVLQNM